MSQFDGVTLFAKGSIITLMCIAVALAIYMVFVLIDAISRDTSIYTLNSDHKRKKINARTYNSLSVPEFYKLQGMTMNDVLRIRMVELNAHDKIVESGNKDAARDTVLRKSALPMSIDEDNNIYVDYDVSAAQNDASRITRGRDYN